MKKKIENLITLILILLGNASVSAHVHWIIPSQLDINKNTEMKISSGHYFPKSNFAIDKKLISEINLYTVSGQKKISNIKSFKTYHFFSPDLKKTDTAVIEVLLKKPVVNKILFYLRYIHPNKKDDEKKYILKKGIEIVPLIKVTEIKKGKKAPFQILHNNKPVSGTITVQTINSTKYWKTGLNGISNIKMNVNGYYLFSTKHRGIGCSLVIYIP